MHFKEDVIVGWRGGRGEFVSVPNNHLRLTLQRDNSHYYNGNNREPNSLGRSLAPRFGPSPLHYSPPFPLSPATVKSVVIKLNKNTKPRVEVGRA